MAGTKLDKYFRLYKNLLPRGRLWRPDEQPVFTQFIKNVVAEFCRVDDRIEDMLENIDPRTAEEAIDLWQKTTALPDECTPSEQTLDEIRQQVIQKLTNVGGLSKNFYEFIGGQLGFDDVTVSNWRNFTAGRAVAGDPLTNYWDIPFVAGSECGNQLYSVGWSSYFNVDMPIAESLIFVAGSEAGDPLREFSNPILECTYKKIKPAYAGVTFTFFE